MTVITTSGKDELNLAEFPIALVTDRIPAGQKTLRFEDRYFDVRKGHEITRRLIVTASDEYGLPTAKDDEVILGLIQLTQQSNAFRNRTVEFNRAELVRLLRWPDTGPSYRRLALSLKRWLGVSLYYENAWWDHRQKRWTTLGFHILDDFLLSDNGRSTGPRAEQALSRFTWNENVFRSFDSGNIKNLDLGFYFDLVHPMAKRLYRFLDKRLAAEPEVELDVRELAYDHIGLSRSYEGATQLVRKLRPAVEELEAKGFLAPSGGFGDRFRKRSPKLWTVVFRREASPHPSATSVEAPGTAVAGPPPFALAKEPEPEPEPALTAEAASASAELVTRDVTPSVAAEIVAGFDLARTRHHIEVHDWLLSRKDTRVMRSPAGFLVQSIRRDYAPPRGFVTEEQRAHRLEVEKRRADEQVSERRTRVEQRNRAEAEEAAARAYWDGLAEPDRERVWADALASAVPFLVEQLRRHSGSPEPEARYRRLILNGYLRDLLAASKPA